MAFALVATGLVDWANAEVEGDHFGTETDAMTDAWEWADAEGWTIEPCREGGFWMVEDGEKVYACLVKNFLDVM